MPGLGLVIIRRMRSFVSSSCHPFYLAAEEKRSRSLEASGDPADVCSESGRWSNGAGSAVSWKQVGGGIAFGFSDCHGFFCWFLSAASSLQLLGTDRALQLAVLSGSSSSEAIPGDCQRLHTHVSPLCLWDMQAFVGRLCFKGVSFRWWKIHGNTAKRFLSDIAEQGEGWEGT